MPKVPTSEPLLGPPGADELVERFEEAWQQGIPPSLEQFLPSAGPPEVRRAILLELLPIDLEYRWRRPSPGARPWVLEDYLARFPELGPAAHLPAELIVEEYRARVRWGDAPPHAGYAARFPAQAGPLAKLLVDMDARLATEYGGQRSVPADSLPMAQALAEGSRTSFSNDVPTAHPLPTAVRTIDSAAALLGLLRDCQVLNGKQLHELSGGAFSEPRLLARHLLDRGWLTPFQANQLFLGRGHDLNLGPYLLLERIGEGLTGEVFKARHLRMDTRMVALKVIRKELLQDPDAVRRFYKEIEAAGRLSHPNVIHPYDAGPVGPTHFLAMEYVEGINLGRLVKDSGPLPVAQACDFVRQVALGLQCIQEHGLVHRDIKPSNLVVSGGVARNENADATQHSPHQTVKILDLGLARVWSVAADSSSTLTRAGAFLGTPDFMAPEQALDPHAVDVRSDLYSLGCTFYYLLSGQPPFPGGTLIQKADRHRWEEPPPIEQFQPQLPAEVASLLRRLLAKQPEQRPQTPAEVAADLAPWSSGSTTEVDWGTRASRSAPTDLSSNTQVLLTPSSARAAAPALASRKRLALLGAAAVLAVCGVAWWLTFGQPGAVTPDVASNSDSAAAAESLLDPAQIAVDERYARQPQELLAVLRLPEPTGQVRMLEFSPDSKWLIGLRDNDVLVWNLTSRSAPTTLHGRAGPILFVQFSGDSRRLMSVSGLPDRATCLWDLETGKELHRVGGGRAAAYSPDGRHYAIESGRALAIHEIATNREVRRLEGHNTGIWSVAYSLDGKHILTGAGVVKMQQGKPLSEDCTARLWDAASGKELVSFGPHPGPVVAVGFCREGRRILTGTVSDAAPLTLWLWDVAAIDRPLVQHRERMVYSPSGRWWFVPHPNKGHEVIDVTAIGPNQPQIVLAEYPPGPSSAGFAADDKTMASVHGDGRVIFWDPATGRRRHVFDLPAPGRTGNFSPDGRYFAASTDKGRVYIFRMPQPTGTGE